MAEVENPAEPFKRAVSAALRALAQERELVVSFGGDDTGMAKDGEARLPQPTNDLKLGDVIEFFIIEEIGRTLQA